jgi:hypothetical protein
MQGGNLKNLMVKTIQAENADTGAYMIRFQNNLMFRVMPETGTCVLCEFTVHQPGFSAWNGGKERGIN